jgi:hypothetical protein
VRRLFEEKKIRVVAPTTNITTLKGNARKNLQILTRFRAGGPGRTLSAPGSHLFAGVFFLLLKERKRIRYCKLLD